MKTRFQALFTGALAAGFFFLPLLHAVEWAPEPGRCVAAASAAGKDILYVYVTPDMGKAGDLWLKALNESAQVDSLLSGRFVFCKVELPSKMSLDKSTVDKAKQALKHGISAVPTMILADSKGRAYGRLLGGIADGSGAEAKAKALVDMAGMKKTRDHLLAQSSSTAVLSEKAALIIQALRFAPAESWAQDYPEAMLVLKEANSTNRAWRRALSASKRTESEYAILDAIARLPASQASPPVKELDDSIKRFETICGSHDLTVERKQFVLLSYVYPLYVRKTSALYKGVNNGELEDAFNRSVEILEQVRDLDPTTSWGRRAHELREELRKARLAAAKYD